MVSSSFNTLTLLALVMVLPLLHVTESASTTRIYSNLNRKQEMLEISNKRFLGGKIVSERLLEMGKAALVNLNGGQSSRTSATATTTTTTPSRDSAFSVKNVEPQKQGNIGRGSLHGHFRMKVKTAGNFIPLNADYNVPRPHPPKHN